MDLSDEGLSIKTEIAIETPYYTDVVEWCLARGFESILAYGTYQFDEATKVRNGALHIAKVTSCQNTDGELDMLQLRLEPVSELEIPGVYDVAWDPSGQRSNETSHDKNCILLATASADGVLRLLNLRDPSQLNLEGASSNCVNSFSDSDVACCTLLDDSILTHVAWGAGGPNGLAAVGQDGMAHQVIIREDGTLEKVAQRTAHDIETWSVEVSRFDSHNLVFTGADDCCLLGWDLREPPDSAPAVFNRRSHEAGVTALACSPLCDYLLASGSYDERVRLFDLRNGLRTPLCESDRLGDGAYHVSWHPCWADVIVVAAMRSGLPVLHYSGEGSNFTELTRYAADAPEGSHGSLAYGVSWQASAQAEGKWLGASASFYDRSIHVWSLKAASSALLTATQACA